MRIDIDNTNILRVQGVTVTALDGSEAPVSEPGTYTLKDRNGAEVAGQGWPANLVLITAGEYAGYLEADLELSAHEQYTLDVTIGTGETGTAAWSVPISPEIRKN